MHSVLIALIQMDHPNGSIPNILNFLWCLWKARNDFLFDRKKALPYQVNIAAIALNLDFDDVLSCLCNKQQQVQGEHSIGNQVPLQGTTLKSDLLIVGPKIFSDAAFRSNKVPGLPQGEVATGVGIFISIPSDQGEINVQVQASASSTSTSLQAEAIALTSAAHIASQLNIAHPIFLTDYLSLAKCAALRNTLDSSIPWNIRKDLAIFFKHTSALHPKVFHISREINGIAHDLAQQVFRSTGNTQVCCFAQNHSSISCHVVSLISNLQIPGVKLHTVHCY